MRCTPYAGMAPEDRAWVDWYQAFLQWSHKRDALGLESAGPEPIQPDGLLATTGLPPAAPEVA